MPEFSPAMLLALTVLGIIVGMIVGLKSALLFYAHADISMEEKYGSPLPSHAQLKRKLGGIGVGLVSYVATALFVRYGFFWFVEGLMPF